MFTAWSISMALMGFGLGVMLTTIVVIFLMRDD
jgi:hypothetical protein